tara:strand:- start:3621 stop:4112 length:492 start_codon:yes stop_codon:yes gene_type:complete
MIDEASPNDADYVSVQDQMSGSTETFTVDLSTVTDPVSSLSHKVTVRAKDSVGFGTITFVVKLVQGATTIATITSYTLSGSAADHTYTLSTAEANSITNYSSLSLQVSATDSMFSGTTTTVYQAFFECPDAPAPSDDGIAGIAYSPARSAASGAAFGITQRTR